MFDPVFAILFMAAVTVPIAATVFVVAVRDRTIASALLLAVAVSIAGVIGYICGAALQLAFYPIFAWIPPLVQMGVSLSIALIAAAVAWKIVLRSQEKSKLRSQGKSGSE